LERERSLREKIKKVTRKLTNWERKEPSLKDGDSAVLKADDDLVGGNDDGGGSVRGENDFLLRL